MGNLLSYAAGSSIKFVISNASLVKNLKEDFEADEVRFDRINFFGKQYVRVWLQGNYKFFTKI